MNILLIGHGAREHVIAETLLRSKHKPKIFAYMKASNPGILTFSEGVEIGEYDATEDIAEFGKRVKADFAIVGPEDPLSHGVVDALQQAGIKTVGPTKKLAQLETSKTFTRDLLAKYDIPGNPAFKSFTKENIASAIDFVEPLSGIVIKADGLCGGKGVHVQDDHFSTKEEGLAIAQDILEKHSAVVIEEKLEGEEFSLMCFSDGSMVVGMPPVQDHKRAHEGDKGPNTGGMGSYSCEDHLLPFLTEKDVKDAFTITEQVCDALQEEYDDAYRGIMYGGFMLTASGVKLIEYNARFGDPEVMNVLPILKSDFVDICLSMVNGNLEDQQVEFEKKATVCKYIVPKGYPDNPVKDEKISVHEHDGALYYYASVDKREDGEIYLSSSRAIGCVAMAESVAHAEDMAERACAGIEGPVVHRKDIGTKELLDKRVSHMKHLRDGQNTTA